MASVWVCCASGVLAETDPKPCPPNKPLTWHIAALTTMGEPLLSEEAADGVETFRFLWLRSFHEPVVVRAELGSPGAPRVTTKVFNAEGKYLPSNIRSISTRNLSRREVRRLRRVVDRVGFWQLPTDRWVHCVDGVERLVVCSDGASWVIEGVGNRRYHVISWPCPEKSEAVWALGKAFLRLTRMRLEPIY